MSDGRSIEWRRRNKGNKGDRSPRCCSDAQGGESANRNMFRFTFPLVADELGILPFCLVILARFPVDLGSFSVSSGEFLVQQTYVGILPGAFCCASNFASL